MSRLSQNVERVKGLISVGRSVERCKIVEQHEEDCIPVWNKWLKEHIETCNTCRYTLFRISQILGLD